MVDLVKHFSLGFNGSQFSVSKQAIMSDFMSRKGDYTDNAVCAKEFRELCQIIGKKFE